MNEKKANVRMNERIQMNRYKIMKIDEITHRRVVILDFDCILPNMSCRKSRKVLVSNLAVI